MFKFHNQDGMIIILNEVLDYCIQYKFTYQKDTAEMMTETSSHPGQNLFQCLLSGINHCKSKHLHRFFPQTVTLIEIHIVSVSKHHTCCSCIYCIYSNRLYAVIVTFVCCLVCYWHWEERNNRSPTTCMCTHTCSIKQILILRSVVNHGQ